MPADSWLTVEEGYIDQCDDDPDLEWHAVVGCTAVISAWGGGAWDPSSRQMLLWGGGHNDYAGNEVYAFSTSTGKWSRLTEPSPGPYDLDILGDGQPVSRHTYDGLAWMEESDYLYAWGGSRAKDGFATGITWGFDPKSTTWTDLAPEPPLAAEYSASAVYDPVSKLVYIKLVEGLMAYDPLAHTYEKLWDLGFPPEWPRYALGHPTGTLDSARGLIWYVGNGLYMVYEIGSNTIVTDEWITTGGGDFSNIDVVEGYRGQLIETGGGDLITASAPGLEYDSKADELVGWVGGGPYVLNLTDKTWSVKSAVGAPIMPTATGTFGRFRYIEAYNVFILVTETNAVHFYKNSAGC